MVKHKIAHRAEIGELSARELLAAVGELQDPSTGALMAADLMWAALERSEKLPPNAAEFVRHWCAEDDAQADAGEAAFNGQPQPVSIATDPKPIA